MVCHNCAAGCHRHGRNRNGRSRYRCPTCRRTFSEARKVVGNGYLPWPKVRMVIHLLVEGNSLRSIERLTNVSKQTIINLLRQVGSVCKDFSRRRIRNVKVVDLQLDECWTFVKKKQRRLKPKDDWQVLGDQYVYIALERHSKLVVAWLLGRRNEASTADFVTLIRDSTASERFQVSSDAYQPYEGAIKTGLHDRADFSQIIKPFRRVPQGPAEPIQGPLGSTVIKSVMGDPVGDRVCTAHVERFNGSLRQWCKRLTRSTYAFSKKWEMLEAALALHFAYCNFCRIHGSLRVTPAMEAGVTDHLWSLDELLEEAVG